MATPVAVASGVEKLLPFAKRIWLPLLNLLGEKHEFRVIVTSPDYMEIRFMWDIFVFEKGEKREFVLRGTEAYAKAIIGGLLSRRFETKRLPT